MPEHRRPSPATVGLQGRGAIILVIGTLSSVVEVEALVRKPKQDHPSATEVNEAAGEAPGSEAGSRQWQFKIPPQLILTAREASLDEKSRAVRRNIHRTLNLSQGLRMRWLGDLDCLEYIKTHYDHELATFYANEVVGMYRGDMCRAAVLAREGGFYTDLDVQLKVPLTSLVSSNTTFMTVHAAANQGMLNAIMAAAPGDPIVTDSIERMRSMYRSGNTIHNLGPTAMQIAMYNFEHTCPDVAPNNYATREWLCGREVVRMLEETGYPCIGEGAWSDEYCPPARAMAAFLTSGATYGLFDEKKELVGWSRMEECFEYGCDAGGHDTSDHLKPLV